MVKDDVSFLNGHEGGNSELTWVSFAKDEYAHLKSASLRFYTEIMI